MSETIRFVRCLGSGQHHHVNISVDAGETLKDAILELKKHYPKWLEYQILGENGSRLLEAEGNEINRQILIEKSAALSAKRRVSYEQNKLTAWPMEKQRGSRVDWHRIVPLAIAEKQTRWERYQNALRMYRCLGSLKKCAPFFGVSSTTFRAYTYRALRNRISPVEKYWKGADVLRPIELGSFARHAGAKPKVRVPWVIQHQAAQ